MNPSPFARAGALVSVSEGKLHASESPAYVWMPCLSTADNRWRPACIFPDTRIYGSFGAIEISYQGVDLMSRRDYEEGYEEARRDMRERELGPSGGGDKGFTVSIMSSTWP